MIQATTINAQAKLYNLELEKLAVKYGLKMIDIVKAFSESKEYLLLDPVRDTIHPNIKGQQVISDKIIEAFK